MVLPIGANAAMNGFAAPRESGIITRRKAKALKAQFEGQTMKSLTLAALVLAASSAVAHAGVIERACIKSDRRAASKSLCGCIQKAADVTLSGNDQRLAAKFFSEPHMAQEIRQSDRSTHEVFWKKYKTFGTTAATYCG